MSAKVYTITQALEKLKSYCAYQERSHYEVEKKLNSLGFFYDQMDTVVGCLIEENFLNEQRFVEAFVSGKLRYKHWGKNKIIQHLKQHRVSSYLLKKAFEDISDNEYISILEIELNKKASQVSSETNFLKKKQKIYNYLLQKGFTYDEISKVYPKEF